MNYSRFLLPLGLITSPFFCTNANATALTIKQNTFSYIDQPATATPNLVILGGYRLYNTSKGHFLKQDSFTPFIAEKTANGFDYGAGNPVLLVDKTGHMPDIVGFADLVDVVEDSSTQEDSDLEDTAASPSTPKHTQTALKDDEHDPFSTPPRKHHFHAISKFLSPPREDLNFEENNNNGEAIPDHSGKYTPEEKISIRRITRALKDANEDDIQDTMQKFREQSDTKSPIIQDETHSQITEGTSWH